MKTLTFFVLVLTLVLINQSDSSSQWTGNPNAPFAICNEPNPQIEPTMITDGSGGYLVFWLDKRNYDISSQFADLYGQRLDAGGNELWTVTGKKFDDSISVYDPPVAVNTGNNAVVLYVTNTTGNKIKAIKTDVNGVSLWASPAIVFTRGTSQLYGTSYVAVTDGSGGIIVSYQLIYAGGTSRVFAQRVNSTGQAQWNVSNNGYDLNPIGEQRGPVITTDGSGGAHIFWYDLQAGPGNIWRTHIASSGSFLPASAFTITPNNSPRIRAVYDGSGGAVVAWAPNGSSTGNIYAQRVNINGTEMWDINGVAVCSFPEAQFDPNLIRTSDGNYIVVWADGRRVSVNVDVYAQKLSAAGNPLWTPNGVLVSNLSGYYPKPNLVSDGSSGAYIFHWGQQLFSVTRINADSTYAWSPSVRTIAVTAYAPSYERFVLGTHSEGAVVFWQTFSGFGGNDAGIYGAKIKSNGILSISLNLTAFIEGFYNSTSNSMIADTVKVYLRSTIAPYNQLDSTKGVLSSAGTGTFYFSNASDGINYYIVVKHRNGLETWSSSGNSFTAGALTYNFSNNSSQAYGNNEKQVDASPLRFAIYSGDVNQDGVVDATDAGAIDNAAFNFATGYVSTDITGDELVDASDAAIVDNNASNFVSRITP